MGYREIVKYLVTHRLAGNSIILFSVRDYFVENLSPSDIAHRYRISKFKIRGYVGRVQSFVDNRFFVAREVIRRVFPLVMNYDPVILRLNGKCYCLLCDKCFSVNNWEESAVLAMHVRYRHRRHVEMCVDEIMRKAGLVGHVPQGVG